MTWNDRNVYVYRVSQAVEQFGLRNIDFPKQVQDTLAVMNRVAAAKPVQPEHTAVREAIRAGADETEIARLLLADATFGRHFSEWNQAHVDSAGAVLAAIRDAAAVLMPKLREQADACIATLRAAADIGGVKLEHLVRAGRTADAKIVAAVDTTAAELDALFDMRDQYLTRGGGQAYTVNNVSFSRWKESDNSTLVRGNTTAERWIAGLTAGLTPWFADPDEAIAAAKKVAEERAAEAQRERQRQHGIGSTVFMGG